MNAAFALRFLPFAFFFAISLSPLNVRSSNPDFSRSCAAGDVKMPNPGERVNVFQRENVPLSLCVAHQPDASASAFAPGRSGVRAQPDAR
jgi:hypothetical protein